MLFLSSLCPESAVLYAPKVWSKPQGFRLRVQYCKFKTCHQVQPTVANRLIVAKEFQTHTSNTSHWFVGLWADGI